MILGKVLAPDGAEGLVTPPDEAGRVRVRGTVRKLSMNSCIRKFRDKCRGSRETGQLYGRSVSGDVGLVAQTEVLAIPELSTGMSGSRSDWETVGPDGPPWMSRTAGK